MVQIIENWAEIEGVIQAIQEHPKLKGYHQLSVKIEKTKPVKDFPNLAKSDVGKTIFINVKPELFKETEFIKEKAFKGLVRKSRPTEYFL